MRLSKEEAQLSEYGNQLDSEFADAQRRRWAESTGLRAHKRLVIGIVRGGTTSDAISRDSFPAAPSQV